MQVSKELLAILFLVAAPPGYAGDFDRENTLAEVIHPYTVKDLVL